MSDLVTQQTELNGTITFANDVIATIAAIAACDIGGVAGMCGGFKDGIAKMLGRKNIRQGVEVKVDEEQSVTVNVEIIMEYGVSAPDMCAKMRESVMNAITTMTGLAVKEVNIAIEGVRFKDVAPVIEEADEAE